MRSLSYDGIIRIRYRGYDLSLYIKAPHFSDITKVRRLVYVCKYEPDYIINKRFLTFAMQIYLPGVEYGISFKEAKLQRTGKDLHS